MLQFASILLVLLLLAPKLSSGFSAPSLGLGAVLFKPAGSKTTLCEEGDLVDAARFFTDAFWASKVGGTKELQPRQRSNLLSSQMSEFRRRYGGGRFAQLLICRNNKGEVMGCCGVEVDQIPEQSLRGRIMARAPLMSNLAVGRKFRRRGIAEDMVQRAEELVRLEWGFDELYLYVERANTPAVRLYQKLGYRKIWQDDTATTLLPLPDGRLQQAPTTLVCMKKKLNRGMLGRLLPF
jgi:ribosomal protein S18 acetylase RimI-like enzyme